MARAVGMGLGTSTATIAVLEAGTPTVIENSAGNPSTHCTVAFPRDGIAIVGEGARRQAVANLGRTVTSIVGRLGSNWSIDIDGERLCAQKIAARILLRLKHDAEDYLGEAVTDVVLTVPVNFTMHKRQAMREAGQIAGLNVRRVISSSAAAALV